MRLDEEKVPTLNVKGNGGKEKILRCILPDYIYVDEPMHDFEHSQDPTDTIETKKQQDCQWFDLGKYHNLSDQQRQIKMMFIMHKDGFITCIFYIPLGDMLDLLCADPDYRKHGWTFDNIKDCSIKKKHFPSMQVKVKLGVKRFYKKYQSSLETVYTAS